jgi:uncharacterized membrane protein
MKNQSISFMSTWNAWCILLVMTFAVMLATGCYYDKDEQLYPGSVVDCTTIPATFANVKTVMMAKCATAGCHNSGSAAGGAVLETYDQIKALAGRINQRVIIDKTMPPGAALSNQEIAILKCWLNSGMPAN